MNRRMKNMMIIGLFSIYIVVMALWLWGKSDIEYSVSERRNLAKKPKITVTSVINGSYMNNFDKYVTDQFPQRETFRKLNSWLLVNIMRKKDVNNIYVKDGYAAKIEDVIDYKSVNWGIRQMRYICDNYIYSEDYMQDENYNIKHTTNSDIDSDGDISKASNSSYDISKDNNMSDDERKDRVYMCIIPDKNYYLTDGVEYPYIDYDEFVQLYRTGVDDYTRYIDISNLLNIDNYYKTDIHWRQETLVDIAKQILDAMTEYDNDISNDDIEDYKVNTGNEEFYGVYYGQRALSMKPDIIRYLTSDIIDDYRVTYADTGEAVSMPVYDMGKASGRDPYEMYLGGSLSLVTIDNAKADTDRRLIIFRDSFGSSLAPLLAEKYKQTVLIDIRYISPTVLSSYVDFENADVLFMYSEQVLNSCAEQFKR
ncbi:MAG: hypothetical protein IIV51_02035 [Lachnospiraceae bacterium]|nr:hypothetical protein [Lachnospiraceae bacterium]